MKIFFAKTFFALMLGVWVCAPTVYAETNISEYSVGKYKVYVMPEDSLAGNIGILTNVNDEDVKKIFPKVNFSLYLNTFLIRGPKQTVLVDAGFGTQLFKHLKSLNVDPKEINNVVLTHMHGDHIGGLLNKGALAFPNATIWVAEKELAYWTDKDIQKALPAVQQSGFAKAQRVVAAYGDKIKTFEPAGFSPTTDVPHYSPDKEGFEILDGIRALATYGHTPGHTSFFVGHGKDALLLWGDIMHVESIQMLMPEVGVVFDVDSNAARDVRIKLLEYINKYNVKVAGMHIGRTGASLIKKVKKGYEFEAVKPH